MVSKVSPEKLVFLELPDLRLITKQTGLFAHQKLQGIAGQRGERGPPGPRGEKGPPGKDLRKDSRKQLSNIKNKLNKENCQSKLNLSAGSGPFGDQ